MNRELIGPKLQSLDNNNIENIFFEPKNNIDSIVLDDNIMPQNENLDVIASKKIKKKITIIEESEIICKKKEENKKKMGFYEAFSNKILKSLSKKQLNPFIVSGKSKRLALKIKKMFSYKNFKNLSSLQKSMINDITDFSWAVTAANTFRVNFIFITIIIIILK